MIDTDGYRMNVGIIIANQDGQLLWAKRIRQNAWQFPQGGVKVHETPKQALFRELYEELGLTIKQVHVLGATRDWLRYRLPHHLIRYHQQPLCIGQKQIWYILRLLADDNNVSLDCSNTPEFDQWSWVDYWYPLTEVVYFKKEVYENALAELHPLVSSYKRRVTYKLSQKTTGTDLLANYKNGLDKHSLVY
ncbi:MAG TPA: RNA pyrophosphohydrolase [Thioploca sp.]|nr:RNA pyrophosphohydrolase [Thioploca sp.]